VTRPRTNALRRARRYGFQRAAALVLLATGAMYGLGACASSHETPATFLAVGQNYVAAIRFCRAPTNGPLKGVITFGQHGAGVVNGVSIGTSLIAGTDSDAHLDMTLDHIADRDVRVSGVALANSQDFEIKFPSLRNGAIAAGWAVFHPASQKEIAAVASPFVASPLLVGESPIPARC
jgi:hypothetical protein